ncbi:IclR family transcriptional regulator [Tropicimonas sp. IMCC6043]|uniref:IclR family transcriptional regulator n=1 Tax=Tropicimonas sp. IMCC6043 TaxID=2510645 RepID=UPI0013EBECB7|nr:IclR family transcriptional regulator [Tropicimonas sp. IMCC6043]
MPGEKTSTREESRHVNSVQNMLDILDCFDFRHTELSLTSLSERTGIAKSRLTKLCNTLLHSRYLSRNGDSLKFRLGPQMMVLGRLAEKTSGLEQISRPAVRKLAEETSETAALFVTQGTRRLCLVREDGDFPIRYVNAEGDILDLYRGAAAMVLLAYMDEEKRDQILKTLERDPDTLLSPSWMELHEQELATIRRRGYAVGLGTVLPDVASIAAPIFDYSGVCRAAIAVVGPLARFSPERREVLSCQVLQTANGMSRVLGFEPEPPTEDAEAAD